MKKNIGKTDRMIRIGFAALIIILYFTHVITGTISIVLGIIAILMLATSFINFCPVYALFGMNTCERPKP